MSEKLAEIEADYDREEYLPDLRGLVMTGGQPYILITVVDPETGEVDVTSAGLPDTVDLPLALQEIALLMAGAE